MAYRTSHTGAGPARVAVGPAPDGGKHLQFLEITPHGGGNEVGRSCLLLKYKGKTVMLDCGVLPSLRGQKALPLFGDINPADVDIIIITHFHLDHCAALPYFTERMKGFRGRIFATHPTVAVMRMILRDYIRVSAAEASAGAASGSESSSAGDSIYSEADVDECLKRIEPLDFHTKLDIDGVGIKFFHAGHVLGAAMVLLEIARVRVLYTGDYSCEEDRHLMAAELPPPRDLPVDVLIVESTHGMTKLESREEREKRFAAAVERIVLEQQGRCLLPVFALGRAQELLLLLEELWEARPDLRKIPIYHANPLAEKALAVYRTFIAHMNTGIQTAMGGAGWGVRSSDGPLALMDGSPAAAAAAGGAAGTASGGSTAFVPAAPAPPSSSSAGSVAGSSARNPWSFKHIIDIAGPRQFRDTGPCVVLASPGMLQSGFSRLLFDKWCENARNGVLLTGYSTEGSLAKDLEANPSEVTSLDNKRMVRRIGIERISFSAHADRPQTAAFIEALKPPVIILVHGESTEMRRLHTDLSNKYGPGSTAASAAATAAGAAAAAAPAGFEVHMPRNGMTITLPYEEERLVKVLGALAAQRIAAGGKVSGVLLQRNFGHMLLAPVDIPRYTDLTRHTLRQKLHVPFRGHFDVLRVFLAAMFPEAEAAWVDTSADHYLVVPPPAGVAAPGAPPATATVCTAASGGTAPATASPAAAAAAAGAATAAAHHTLRALLAGKPVRGVASAAAIAAGSGGMVADAIADASATTALAMPVPGASLRHIRRAILLSGGSIKVVHAPPDRVVLCWNSGPIADAIADSAIALLAQAEVSRTSIKMTTMIGHGHGHSHGHDHGGGGCRRPHNEPATHDHHGHHHADDVCCATPSVAAGGGGDDDVGMKRPAAGGAATDAPTSSAAPPASAGRRIAIEED